ncbi:MAG: High-affinity branched-chain amino acid transport ATP-binding protein LivF [Synergistetes bacterium ADurb.BinA166]|jgi:branched-chain amino acid transport system ATP-binding protein|nr:ATP-binding cassette domain-containing protein [Acidobacteriota bacterium]OPZ35071.1 MAG: High-affinity branched-chain amino acid transport ATP-binding protein LivF [Synergistetes bacterium ADurb.BinA166]
MPPVTGLPAPLGANGPLLRIAELTAGYRGKTVIENLDLVLDQEDMVALIGPNGCGKSTLLRAVTGVIPKASGEVKLRGRPLQHLPTHEVIRSGVGYLKQTRNIFPGLTVEQNLLLAHPDGRASSASRLRRLLSLFPLLADLQLKRAGLLSGGERQALALAMVLMRKAEVLLLDEPVSGLSPDNAEALLSGLDQLRREDGFSFLLVEHRLRVVAPWVNRILIMVRGRIVEDTRDVSILTDRQRLERHYQL